MAYSVPPLVARNSEALVRNPTGSVVCRHCAHAVLRAVLMCGVCSPVYGTVDVLR